MNRSEKRYGDRVQSKTKKGKYSKSRLLVDDSNDIAVDATLRAGVLRSVVSGEDFSICSEDFREKIRRHGACGDIVLVVDMSGSMMSKRKANMLKGIIYQIVENANKHKDKLAVVGFKGQGTEVLIPNTIRPTSHLGNINNLKVGGTTPMAAGIEKAIEILDKETKKQEYIPITIILSDGMPNVTHTKSPIEDVINAGKKLAKKQIYTIIIDFEHKSPHRRNINIDLTIASKGNYYDFKNIKDYKQAINKLLNFEREIGI